MDLREVHTMADFLINVNERTSKFNKLKKKLKCSFWYLMTIYDFY